MPGTYIISRRVCESSLFCSASLLDSFLIVANSRAPDCRLSLSHYGDLLEDKYLCQWVLWLHTTVQAAGMRGMPGTAGAEAAECCWRYRPPNCARPPPPMRKRGLADWASCSCQKQQRPRLSGPGERSILNNYKPSAHAWEEGKQ